MPAQSTAQLRHQINSAHELESVVRTMKALSAANIVQYENAVRALAEYYRTVQLGLIACQQHSKPPPASATGAIGVIVFGSDQGLVGQFNEDMAEFVLQQLALYPQNKLIYVVGERLHSRLAEQHLPCQHSFKVPNAIPTITELLGQLLLDIESQREHGTIEQIYLFHHSPQFGAIYTPTSQRLLPLDQSWWQTLAQQRWPTNNLPEVINTPSQTQLALIREYLFVSLFQACAESLACENATRLAAMQRAEKNIDELLSELQHQFYQLRQSHIDAELFDVIAGFEALGGRNK